jgi:hypothetical protein
MGNAIKNFKLGKINATVWENEFEGKKNYSATFQKSYKDKSDIWKNTNFFTFPDLRDLYNLVGYMIHKQVKEVMPKKKTADEEFEKPEGFFDYEDRMTR